MHNLHEEVLVSLRQIIRATDLHSRRLGRDTGLTTPQLVVLRAISEQGAPAVSEIARSVSLSQATVTTILNRLQSNGLVRRERSRSDKRRVNVHLSGLGKRLLETAPEPLQDSFISRFSALEDWEQHLIVAALQRVAAMMDAESLEVAPLLAADERFG
jgi:DNA-binding MarR family transcriptional regulator